MIYRFGCHSLDTERLEFRRDDGLLTVEPQVFALLVYLVQNRDRVVGKDEIIENVWQGRIVSDGTLNSRINSLRRAVGDSGDVQAVVRTYPKRGFRFVAEVKESAHPETGAAVEAHVPNNSSIAVLPFVNMSAEPDQEYFADGMVDEIITALSRLRWLYVAARTSSFQFEGQHLDVRDIASKLGVRYILEGSVRKADRRVRIIGQLIDATTGGHLWAERFEGQLDDIFDLQDEITKRVVTAIEPNLFSAEVERARRKRPENLDAYDYYLRAFPHVYASTRDSIDEGHDWLESAIVLDPAFAPVLALASWFCMHRVVVGWSRSPDEDTKKGAQYARTALLIDPDDPRVLSHAPFALATLGGDLDAAAAATERGVDLYPISACVLGQSGYVLTLVGDQDRSLGHFKAALRVSPGDPVAYRYLTGAGIACTLSGLFDEAVAHCEEARRRHGRWGTTYRILSASYAHLGQTDRAAEALARYLELNPASTITHLRRQLPYRDPVQADRLWSGLRAAGLPE